jgi:hypothetical protein
MKILRTKTFAEGSNAKKVRKVTDKVDTGLTIGTHGTLGAGLGYTLGGKRGAIIGGALGSGTGYVKDLTNRKIRQHIERQGKKVKEPEEATRTPLHNAISDGGTVGISYLIGRELGGDIKLRRELEKAAKDGRVLDELGKELHYASGRKKGKKIGALVGVSLATNEWAKRKALKQAHKKDKKEEEQEKEGN